MLNTRFVTLAYLLSLGTLAQSCTKQARHSSSIKSEPADLADRECRVILREAELVSCMRGSCMLDAIIDVRKGIEFKGLKIVYRSQGEAEFRSMQGFEPVSSPNDLYDRYRSSAVTPYRFAVPTRGIELISVLETNDHSYFDHNSFTGDFENLKLPGSGERFIAAANLCE